MSRKKIPPSIDDVKKYVIENNYKIDPEQFFDHHEARGWWLGKVKMKDWQAAVRTWVRNEQRWNPTGNENKKEWHETSTGIIEMGKIHGISESDYYHFQEFKKAVFDAVKGKRQLRLVV